MVSHAVVNFIILTNSYVINHLNDSITSLTDSYPHQVGYRIRAFIVQEDFRPGFERRAQVTMVWNAPQGMRLMLCASFPS